MLSQHQQLLQAPTRMRRFSRVLAAAAAGAPTPSTARGNNSITVLGFIIIRPRQCWDDGVCTRHMCMQHLLCMPVQVTYNLLSDKYIGWHTGYCDRQHLAWQRRSQMIKQELEGYAANIVCLQEVEDRVFHEELQPFFESKNMQGWFMARQSGEVQGPPEGVALFVDRGMFQIERQLSAQFADHAQDVARYVYTESDGWRVFKQKEEGVVMALLKHRPSGQSLVAACTHLFWNPKYPDVKALQAMALCHQLARFVCAAGGAQQPQEVPVILGGDFNSLPRKHKPDVFDKVIPAGPDGLVSGVYTLLREGRLAPTHPDHPRSRQPAREGVGTSSSRSPSPSPYPAPSYASPAPAPHRSVLIGSSRLSGEGGREELGRLAGRMGAGSAVVAQAVQQEEEHGAGELEMHTCGLRLDSMHRLAHGREPALTTKTASFAGCLDYIWISPQWFRVSNVLGLPYSEPSTNGRGPLDPLTDINFPTIPDEHYPSDHLAMGCVLELLPQPEALRP